MKTLAKLSKKDIMGIAAKLSIICCILSIGCNRKDNATTTTPAVPDDTSYVVTGIMDVNFDKPVAERIIALTFSPATSKRPDITLSLDGLPQGVSYKFEPATGIIPFSSTLHISNNFGNSGIYDISFKGRSTEGTTKVLHFNLSVPAYTCTDRIAARSGNYTLTTPGNVGGIPISKPAIQNGDLIFNGLYVETFDKGTPNTYSTSLNNVIAVVNCNNGTIIIPEQQYTATGSGNHIYKYSGSGNFSFTDRRITINYQVSEGNRIMYFSIKGVLN